MRIRIIIFFMLTISIAAIGQTKTASKSSSNTTEFQIQWQKPVTQHMSNSEIKKYLFFTGAEYTFDDELLPSFTHLVSLSNQQTVSATLLNTTYVALSDEEVALIKNPKKISNQIVISTTIQIVKKQPKGIISFIPIRKNSTTGKFEKLVSFDLSIAKNRTEKSNTRSLHTYAAHSVLQSGKWYKMAIPTDGIYKISYQFLQSLGMDVASIDPQNIRIYGNGKGMLAELASIARPDDLVENAIAFQGNTDATFDPNEYFLFYAKGPNTWSYNSATCPKFKHTLNLYSDSSYYFITSDLGAGKRMQTQPTATATATNTVTTFDDYTFHEKDDLNFIKSGRQWFGEYFENNPTYNFSFSFPNIDNSSTSTVKANIASKYSSNSTYTVNGNPVTVAMSSGDTYAQTSNTCFSFNPSSSLINVNVTKVTTDAIGWLDYIEVNVRRQLTMSGNQLIFRDVQSVGIGNVAQYNLASSNPIQIWDVTDPTNAYWQSNSLTGTTYQFRLPADTLKQFVAFTGLAYLTPTAIGTIANQDLHGLANKDFIIVTHPDFINQASQLATFHENTDGLTTNVVTTQQIFNEFSSGAQDATAIRDFVKMFYDRAADSSQIPKYLLLFGDGSYDNKHRFTNNTNYIPTYESVESQSLTGSYVSDDFYGCLDNNEGLMQDLVDAVDLGVGRFPVNSLAQANAAISKVFAYKRTGVPPTTENVTNSCTSQTTGSPFGDWRNTVCFIADDEDGGLHEGIGGQGADQLAKMIDSTDYNIDKIYFDAYQQVATPGGDRYPDASLAITKRVEKGALIMNYTGHGGEVGLAHERVVEVSQINAWKNINNMPFWVTATCELSRYDDPERTSAGEYIFLNPTGAGIGLLTTVREAFASPNFVINTNFYRSVFTPVNGKMPALGDVYEYVKNHQNGNNVYGRNFTLLGDPALSLNYPKWDVSTDTINTNVVTSTSLETLNALSHVTISGFVRDKSHAILNTYNGVLYPTVYDKTQNITTLSNDGTVASPPFTFQIQKNILFKGKVSVTNGYFRFSFVVPRDIAYQNGPGRITYYAENGNEDANGFYEKVIIGGSSSSAPADLVGPEVKLYLNDAKFAFGGLTNENPDLYATMKDNNGINTVGNGIGHDITAVLDGNTGNSIVLNDYYQSDLNSYKSGMVRYPFSSLGEGKHTLKLKVWDVYNNSSESYTEFVVSKSAELALEHVLNYPNPFTTHTQFYFEENQCCQTLEVQVMVFTISGKLVKTIDQFIGMEGFRSAPIDWDGRDDFGDKIGRGVYIYRVKVKTNDGSSAEKYEKLVILN